MTERRKPSPRDELERLAALLEQTDDPDTQKGLALAVAARALEALDDAPPTAAERLVAVLPDCVAVVALVAAAVAGVCDMTTAGAFVLAVLSGRLYPRRGLLPPKGGGSGGTPPSGVMTLGAALALRLKGGL